VSEGVAQVHDERVQVVREALRRGGVAGAVEFVDEALESLLCVAFAGVRHRAPASRPAGRVRARGRAAWRAGCARGERRSAGDPRRASTARRP